MPAPSTKQPRDSVMHHQAFADFLIRIAETMNTNEMTFLKYRVRREIIGWEIEKIA